MKEIARTPHWIVAVDGQIVRATRTSEPFADESQIHGSLARLKSQLMPERAKMGLLVDLRNGPFRNDDVFERAVHQYRLALFGGWGGVANVVSTQIGKLQVRRLAREDGVDLRVLDDEREALAYLAQKLA